MKANSSNHKSKVTNLWTDLILYVCDLVKITSYAKSAQYVNPADSCQPKAESVTVLKTPQPDKIS